MECVSSLNIPPCTLLWLSLEFCPMGGQETTLGGHPRDFRVAWDVTIFSYPTLFPATVSFTQYINLENLSLSMVTDRNELFHNAATETEQDLVRLLGIGAFPGPLFVVCRQLTLVSMTSELQKAYVNSC